MSTLVKKLAPVIPSVNLSPVPELNADQKLSTCVRCDKPNVIVSVWASHKATLCPECDALVSARIPQSSGAKHQGDTKVCPCTVCSAEVTVTKFATPSKVVCDKCKVETKRQSRAKYDGNTKVVKCTECGIDTEVTKFATPALAKCPKCKDADRQAKKQAKAKSTPTPKSKSKSKVPNGANPGYTQEPSEVTTRKATPEELAELKAKAKSKSRK